MSRFDDVESLPYNLIRQPHGTESPTMPSRLDRKVDPAVTGGNSLALVGVSTLNESRVGEHWAVTCVTVPFWLQKGGT